jgi:hypothetical protein
MSKMPFVESENAPWMNGHIGPLKAGRMLALTLKRPENTFYVNADYEMIHEEATELFESFLGLRMKYMKHKYSHTPGSFDPSIYWSSCVSIFQYISLSLIHTHNVCIVLCLHLTINYIINAQQRCLR